MKAKLTELLGARALFDEPMRRHTTLKIGGPADVLLLPRSIDEIRTALAICAEAGLRITPIGGGSNLLCRDSGVRGAVLSTKYLRDVTHEQTRVRATAGVSTGKLLSLVTQWELGGLEFLAGVPGSVGGGLVMNAGTYLGEFKDVTRLVRSVSLRDGSLLERDNAACGFRYRGSQLPTDELVVEGEFELVARPRQEIEEACRALRERRDSREPKRVSNAGSVFKNPPGDFAGRLIEACGLKGTRVGDAECSPVHANWFVNHGSATAAQMMELIDLARARVLAEHGIKLELEWKVIGDD